MDNARTITVRLANLLSRERAALGEFLVALADFDHRRLWVELGYPSLFDFLRRELGLSNASASFRKKAAELIQQHPEVLEPIRDGRLCLSSVFELAKVLAPDNCSDVLPRFFHVSKRGAKAVVAALRPEIAPPQREMVTAVRVPAVAAMVLAVGTARKLAAPDAPRTERDSVGGGGSNGSSSLAGQTHVTGITIPGSPSRREAEDAHKALAAPPTAIEHLTAEVNRLHISVSPQFLEKLDAARAALSHSQPGASASEILEAGLDLLLERDAKRKALVKTPRAAPRAASNRDHIPAHVKREVWKRDGGKCQWRLASGGICGSTHQVQLDHVVPKALGGPPTVENLRCLCRAHNDLYARQTFGDQLMDRYTRNPRKPRKSHAPRDPPEGSAAPAP